jgi:hypothetical protein
MYGFWLWFKNHPLPQGMHRLSLSLTKPLPSKPKAAFAKLRRKITSKLRLPQVITKVHS